LFISFVWDPKLNSVSAVVIELVANWWRFPFPFERIQSICSVRFLLNLIHVVTVVLDVEGVRLLVVVELTGFTLPAFGRHVVRVVPRIFSDVSKLQVLAKLVRFPRYLSLFYGLFTLSYHIWNSKII